MDPDPQHWFCWPGHYFLKTRLFLKETDKVPVPIQKVSSFYVFNQLCSFMFSNLICRVLRVEKIGGVKILWHCPFKKRIPKKKKNPDPPSFSKYKISHQKPVQTTQYTYNLRVCVSGLWRTTPSLPPSTGLTWRSAELPRLSSRRQVQYRTYVTVVSRHSRSECCRSIISVPKMYPWQTKLKLGRILSHAFLFFGSGPYSGRKIMKLKNVQVNI